MNKIMCFLTGGHRYKASNLQSHIDDTYIVHFTNFCVKCGKKYTCTIPYVNLLSDFCGRNTNSK